MVSQDTADVKPKATITQASGAGDVVQNAMKEVASAMQKIIVKSESDITIKELDAEEITLTKVPKIKVLELGGDATQTDGEIRACQ